jgi:hypothetical protein
MDILSPKVLTSAYIDGTAGRAVQAGWCRYQPPLTSVRFRSPPLISPLKTVKIGDDEDYCGFPPW